MQHKALTRVLIVVLTMPPSLTGCVFRHVEQADFVRADAPAGERVPASLFGQGRL